jgi:hypothetical protein
MRADGWRRRSLWLMGFRAEFARARDWVATKFAPEKSNWDGSVFEITIRYMGGLLAAYELSGDAMFLDKTRQLADRLLPAFETASGLALTTINLASGRATNPGWNGQQCVLAEFGTLGLEWRALSHYTGDARYRAKVDRIAERMRAATSNGLLPTFFDQHSGAPSNAHITYGARGDSYYEYLLKQWLQSGKRDAAMLAAFEQALRSTVRLVVRRSTPSGFVHLVELSGDTPINKMDELVCFVGGMFALAAVNGVGANVADDDRDVDTTHLMQLADGVAHTCWTVSSLACVCLLLSCKSVQFGALFSKTDGKFHRNRIGARDCHGARGPLRRRRRAALSDRRRSLPTDETCTLIRARRTTWCAGARARGRPRGRPVFSLTVGRQLRPETVETLFYMWRTTHKPIYRERAWQIFSALLLFAVLLFDWRRAWAESHQRALVSAAWQQHARVKFGFSGVGNVQQVRGCVR